MGAALLGRRTNSEKYRRLTAKQQRHRCFFVVDMNEVKAYLTARRRVELAAGALLARGPAHGGGRGCQGLV